MPTTITASTTIEAEPAAVWSVLTDFARYPQWNPFMDRVEGRAEAGQRLVVHVRPGRGRGVTVRPTVLVADPGRELRWFGKLVVRGLFDGEHSFVLSALPGGRTHLEHAETFRGLLVRGLGGPLRRTQTSYDAMNAALKERVEAPADRGTGRSGTT